ncbi:MAG: ribulose-phosphate 3-epimerase [Erysipelotrichaceae bacterium]|nr:ribulose-phosphate 3-epimerase [Erysipelotrichaceae bacterium]
MGKTILSASLLSADFANIESEVKKCEENGVDWIHYDVMDGHFVDNITFGFAFIEQSKKHHNLVCDVHIMIDNPFLYARRFCRMGADILTFHYEACKSDKQIFQIIDDIHQCGCKAGLSINPKTPVSKLFPFLHSLDLVLIMSVEPGYGGQPFDENAPDKVKALKEYMNEHEIKNTLISIDGGINGKTAPIAKAVGCDVLVSGSYLFKAEDFKATVEQLKK